MSQLQKHQPSKRLYVDSANGLTKDKSVSTVVVTLDTAQWSSRKKNIVIAALQQGITACGHNTSQLVSSLCEVAGAQVESICRWNHDISVEAVKPEKLDALIAYTCAWIRLRGNDMPSYSGLLKEMFIETVARGEHPDYIPLPSFLSATEQVEFIKEYLRDRTDLEFEAAQRLIALIQKGEPITVTYRRN